MIILSVKCPETVQHQDSEFDQPALTLQVTKPALNADLEHQDPSPPFAGRQDPYQRHDHCDSSWSRITIIMHVSAYLPEDHKAFVFQKLRELASRHDNQNRTNSSGATALDVVPCLTNVKIS